MRDLVEDPIGKPEDISCPVCGYYCLGKGGYGCIDKPTLAGFKISNVDDHAVYCDFCGGIGTLPHNPVLPFEFRGKPTGHRYHRACAIQTILTSDGKPIAFKARQPEE